jgi:hypothetical protein
MFVGGFGSIACAALHATPALNGDVRGDAAVSIAA